MTFTNLIRRLHEHRVWVNRQLIDAGRRLSAEQLRQQFPIGQGSVWNSLVHMHAAEYVWLAALLGDEQPLLPGDVAGKLPGNQEGDNPIASLDELAAGWDELDRRWREYLANLDPAALDGVVYKVSTSSAAGQRFGTRRADVLLHVCTHSHYTAAQIVNMLRHLGVAPLPDAMLISLVRQEAAAELSR
jgi:uncharacterized damage-inducible protein DinB